MTAYTVSHLDSPTEFTRGWALVNNLHSDEWHHAYHHKHAVETFHRNLTGYKETKLHSLPSVALELGLAHVFVKDESTRFGLPAFKILGASWALHRAICQRLGIPSTSTSGQVRNALRSADASGREVRLVTCSEGNWGRACARVSAILGLPCTVYVPGSMSEDTRRLLLEEGAEVEVLRDGSYDDAIMATRHIAETTGALMVMDTSWNGYEEIPEWVTEGYGTMLSETDRQVLRNTGGAAANMFFVSVGVGSWAHSVVRHYKATDSHNRIISVEPDAAASLKESLHCGGITPIATKHTIMAGMCCGTTSKIAWPVLRNGVYAAVTVTDLESHESVEFLNAQGINAGPCGAATLAALRKYVQMVNPQERRSIVVVLFSTEGGRNYQIPSRVNE